MRRPLTATLVQVPDGVGGRVLSLGLERFSPTVDPVADEGPSQRDDALLVE